MQPTDSERLKTVLEKLDVDPHRLTLSLDYKNPSIVYNIIKGKQEMDIEFIDFFISKYPQVNFLYLKEGRGNPILSISEAIAQRSILGLSNEELNIKTQNVNQHLNLIEKRLNVIEKMLSQQNVIQTEASEENDKNLKRGDLN